jgi:hypothetical protein
MNSAPFRHLLPQVQALMQAIGHYESLTAYTKENVKREGFEREWTGGGRKKGTLSHDTARRSPSSARMPEVQLLLVNQRVTLHSSPCLGAGSLR